MPEAGGIKGHVLLVCLNFTRTSICAFDLFGLGILTLLIEYVLIFNILMVPDKRDY